MTGTIDISKLNTYAVLVEKESAKISKLNTYAVLLEQGKASVTKLNTYAVLLENIHEVFQDVSADRPLYRDAPSGGIPYVDMSGTGAALKVNVPEADTYTIITYNADQTFTVIEQSMTAGENTITISEDFNQLVGLRGGNIHRFAIDAVKEGMKARAV